MIAHYKGRVYARGSTLIVSAYAHTTQLMITESPDCFSATPR